MPIMTPEREARYARDRVEREARSRPLYGKTAMITGAASGVGRAIAEHMLAHTGAEIVAVDVNKIGLDDLKLENNEDRLSTYACDLAEHEAIEQLPREVDVLVNSAGILRLSPLDEYDNRLFSNILRLMLETPALLSRNTLPHMREQGWGRIIHISSTMGKRAQPYKAAYVAAKHGLEGLSKVIAAEGAPHGITSNTVVLSHVDTPLVHRQIADESAVYGMDIQTYLDEVLYAPLAIKKLLDPSDVGKLIEVLYGPISGNITGTSLTMDLGWTGC